MATISKTIPAASGVQNAWKMVSNIGAVDKLVDMIQSCELHDDLRICTLEDGQSIKEKIITVDADAKRLVYTITEGPMPIEFHCASVVVSATEHAAELTWTVDVKPDALAAPLSDMMDAVAASMAQRLA
ncbi:MAG: SRPBCC family protein [Thalassovita sp.]